ncbi:unnamed protein product [Caenorhabditis brenneri]
MGGCQEPIPLKEKIGTAINKSSTGLRTSDTIKNFEEKLQEFDERIKHLNQIAQNIRCEAQQYKEVQRESFQCFKKLVDEKVSSILSDPERFLRDNTVNVGSGPSQGANNIFRILKTMKDSIVEKAGLSTSAMTEKVCLQNQFNTEDAQPLTSLLPPRNRTELTSVPPVPEPAEHAPIVGQRIENKPQKQFIEAHSVPESLISTRTPPTLLTDDQTSQLDKSDSNGDVDENSAQCEREKYDWPIKQAIRGKWKLLLKESINIEEFLCDVRTKKLKHEVHYKDLKFLLNNDQLSTFSGENDNWTIQDHKKHRKNSDGTTKYYYIENNCVKTIHKHRGVAVEKASRYIENDELIVETWLERNEEKGLVCVRRFKKMP